MKFCRVRIYFVAITFIIWQCADKSLLYIYMAGIKANIIISYIKIEFIGMRFCRGTFHGTMNDIVDVLKKSVREVFQISIISFQSICTLDFIFFHVFEVFYWYLNQFQKFFYYPDTCGFDIWKIQSDSEVYL